MDLSEALATFMEESRDLLARMEEILLAAESRSCSQEDLHALFRCAHTIKGSAGMFGLDAIVAFTHVVENALDRLREGSVSFSPPLIAALLHCRDHLAALVEAVAAGHALPMDKGNALLARLQEVLGPAPAALPAAATAPPAQVEASGGGPLGADHWHLSLRFGPDLLRNGMDPLALIQYLGGRGTILHLETISDALPPHAQFDPESCYLGFEIAFRSEADKGELEAIFDFVRTGSRIRILPPHTRCEEFIELIHSLPEDPARLGEILVACGTLTGQELATALAAQAAAADAPPLGQVLVREGMVRAPVVAAALDKQQRNAESRPTGGHSIKVPAERLDQLIDLIGQLVIAGASSEVQAKRSGRPEMLEANAQVLRLVEDIRDTALKLRMVPIGEVFSRFPRVVRDVSRELGKDIELKIGGADAELDKSMVERIADPLMHLIRNAMDHGVENTEVRLARGKPPRGTVSLNAYHESGSIVIEVSDDGGGLDSERILAKARARGLVAPGQTPGRAEIFNLIMEPGFSTAEKVTSLSGRGVGMDVVRSNVEALRGSLHIDSEPGQGTTMRICLPLTLAIIDGFQVAVGDSTFILPLDLVVECMELPAEAEVRDYLNLRGRVLPFLRLRSLFAVGAAAPARQNVVVVRFAGQLAGLAVDRLLGECQTVIKPLGRLFSQVSGISGSTILGSGEVALILDVPQLIQLAAARSAALHRSPLTAGLL